MKIRNRFSVAATLVVALFAFCFYSPNTAFAATTPSLGAAAVYGVLSSTYTDTSGATTVNGSVGFTTPPATAIGGAHTYYGSGAPYATAGVDQGAALTALNAQACTFDFAPGAIDLSTDITHGPAGVYTPGVYCSTGAMDVGGPITLSGAGTYIFRPVGALTSTAGAVVTLTGASACDVFWTPTQATTLAANTTFKGTIIDNAGITVGANTTWEGRALAFGGTVTTDTDTITVPSCTLNNATLHVIKLVVSGGGESSVPADFSVNVKTGGVDVGGSPQAGAAAPGTSYTLAPATYTVSETPNPAYTTTFTGDCNSSGNITLFPGQDATCTIVNTKPATSSGASYFTRNVPLIGILKVPTPLALPSGVGPVTYDYTVWNVGGQQPLVDVTVTDDKCGPITLLSGDINSNTKLDPGENWKYSCNATLSQTTTNTSIATGYSDDSFHEAAVATAIATVVVGAPLTPPLINIVKVPSRLTSFPIGGGSVMYTYFVSNPGIVPMTDVTVTDDKCGPVSRIIGDTNNDNLLDPTETWTYTCQMNVYSSTRNVAMAKGKANGFTALGYAFADVFVNVPGLPNTGLFSDGKINTKGMVVLLGIFLLAFVSLAVFLKKKSA